MSLASVASMALRASYALSISILLWIFRYSSKSLVSTDQTGLAWTVVIGSALAVGGFAFWLVQADHIALKNALGATKVLYGLGFPVILWSAGEAVLADSIAQRVGWLGIAIVVHEITARLLLFRQQRGPDRIDGKGDL
jgi:hypothetical protein